MTREHFVSEGLLRELNRDQQLQVGGFPWQSKGEPKSISPNALASKILCDRHNSALSSVDAIALRVFRAFDNTYATTDGLYTLTLFSGVDLERWMLKILCGLVYSGSFPAGQNFAPTIPHQWLDILFGRSAFSAEQGLYVCKDPGHVFQGPYGVQMRPIVRQGNLSGLGMEICGLEFVLSMTGLPTRQFDGRNFAFRPMEILTTGKATEKSVCFTWEGAADFGTISINIA